jgi:hypothetical protein
MDVRIESRPTWVNTGIRLVAGTSYRLSASGQWKDASILTDANGYRSVNAFQRLTERLRRQPDARWFTLIGAIDRRPETQFVIGSGCDYHATASGELTCFANDLRGFYFNNAGSITLTVG